MSSESYRVDSDEERAVIAEFGTLGGTVKPLVCEHGHVHVMFSDIGMQVTLSPEQAETWVEMLYDAAQEAAVEASDE